MDKFTSDLNELNHHVFQRRFQSRKDQNTIIFVHFTQKDIVCNTMNTLFGYYSATVHLLTCYGTYI